MIQLGINIDHVATLRQARYRETPDSPNAEPDPVEAAMIAERAGAQGITVHLRADRRHIQDRDLWRLKEKVRTKLNLELGNTPEILEIALKLKPEDVCLVPENRQEVTTEGGLDCAGQIETLRPTIQKLQSAGIRVSLFIDPDPSQIEAAAKLGAEFIELHTGAYANHFEVKRDQELQRLIDGAKQASASGIKVNAGHGLNYTNIAPILKIPNLVELNIGHSIISRATFVGMEQAVRDMLLLIQG
ncbi:MAG: pyridoxine 5'-phosphate synthase [Chthoniobacterales bacterium]